MWGGCHYSLICYALIWFELFLIFRINFEFFGLQLCFFILCFVFILLSLRCLLTCLGWIYDLWLISYWDEHDFEYLSLYVIWWLIDMLKLYELVVDEDHWNLGTEWACSLLVWFHVTFVRFSSHICAYSLESLLYLFFDIYDLIIHYLIDLYAIEIEWTRDC